MTRSNKKRRIAIVSALASLLAFAPCAVLSPQAADANGTGARTALEFADWLRAGGDDANAEREYLRCLFQADADGATTASAVVSRAVLALAEIYRANSDYEKIPPLAARYENAVTDAGMRRKLDFLKGLALLKRANGNGQAALSGDIEGDEGSTALALADRLYRDDLAGAITVLNGGNPDFSRNALVHSIRTDVESFKPKNEILAVGLSALVPGLGKAYAGQIADAVFSFVTTGALSALTVYAAANEGPTSWKTWTYGISAGVMYGANLYGSRQAALRYNETRLKEIRAKMDDILDEYPR